MFAGGDLRIASCLSSLWAFNELMLGTKHVRTLKAALFLLGFIQRHLKVMMEIVDV